MRGYKHLTYHDRLKIDKLLREGKKQVEIARILHVSESTISREIRRSTYEHMNSDLTTKTRYNPDGAQERYEYNKTAKGAALKISNDCAFAAFMETKIVKEKFSPAAVLAIIRNNPDLNFKTKLCERTIYNYIDKGVFRNITSKELPYRGKRKKKIKKEQKKPFRVSKGESIEKRPKEVNERKEFGNWEMDSVVSCKTSNAATIVMTERKTRQEITFLVPDHTSASVVSCINILENQLGDFFPKIFKSITMDNGVEFSDCNGIEKSLFGGKRTKCYYCHPYCSSERGSNEKQNQMLRRHFPKGTDFSKVSEREMSFATSWLNNYPRKLFNWRTSQQLFDEEMRKITPTPPPIFFSKKLLH